METFLSLFYNITCYQMASSKRYTSTSSLRMNQMSLSTILPVLLQYQLLLKIFHWQTTSYAHHKVSDTLYGQLSEFIDTLVEYDQGVNVRFSLDDQQIILQNMDDKDAGFLLLKQLSLFLEVMETRDKGIRARRDDLIGYINQALYLLKLT